MHRNLWIGLLVIGFLAGCGPKVVNHPQPDLRVDFSPFENAGCALDEYGWYRCQEDSTLYKLGCDVIEKTPDMLGGLSPAYPMATCLFWPYYHKEITDPFNYPEDEYFFNIGGPMPELVRYVLCKQSTQKLVVLDRVSDAIPLVI